MNAPFDHFPLRGCCLGISISAGDEGIPLGENPEVFINQLTFRTCSRYLYLGASIVLGHQWKTGGIMDHLVRKAAEFRYSFPPPGTTDRRFPLINRVAWPDEPPVFDDDQREQFQDFLEIQQVVPPGIPTAGLDDKSSLGKFARIRALTALRRTLVALSHARICLGGAAGKPLRRLPGVIEEALFTYQVGQPLYLAGALGGATKTLCDAILHRRLSSGAEETFYTPSAAAALFAEFAPQYPVPVAEGPSRPNSPCDALAEAASIPVATLAERAALSLDDYLTLMTTPDLGRALQLVSTGLSRRSAK